MKSSLAMAIWHWQFCQVEQKTYVYSQNQDQDHSIEKNYSGFVSLVGHLISRHIWPSV
jgi:hypothetical protein